MKTVLKYVALSAIAFSLAACRGATVDVPKVAEATTATTAEGHLVGFIAENGAHVWRGVHYAGDTSGENRWRAPKPAPHWDGTKEALKFGPVCPQIATPFTPIESFTNGELEGSEDSVSYTHLTLPTICSV